MAGEAGFLVIGFRLLHPQRGYGRHEGEAQDEGAEQRAIELKTPGGDFRFLGRDFVHEWALPNFYFHVTTAYNLLRHNGVPVGKLEEETFAEGLGFESLFVFDHFHTVPEPTDEITFESFSMLAALAMATRRVRLGHMVICTGFRNPGLTAKLASTIDALDAARDVSKADTHAQAKHSCDKVLPAMLKVRAAADALEEIVADEYWPLPSYQELLFLR